MINTNHTLFDRSLERITQLAREISQSKKDLNEADTRHQVIDVILHECLGWQRNDVELEQRLGNEYADYVLTLVYPKAIVEAKREGVYFSLPTEKKKQRIYSLKSLLLKRDALSNAINQVTGYCHSRGVPIAILCNGYQFVGFIASRNDGVPPSEGKAIVFHSLDDIKNNFKEFWNLLSRHAVSENQLSRNLLGNSLPEIPSKLSSKINDFPGVIRRNLLQTDMQMLSEIILEDALKSTGIEQLFLKECYSKSGAISQYSQIGKNILNSRYSFLSDKNSSQPNVVPANNKKGLDKDLEGIFKDQTTQNIMNKRPILIIGDVGVGKSTFIDNLIHVEARELLKEAICLKVDLGSRAIITDNIQKAIFDELALQLREQYYVDIFENSFVRGTYDLEIIQFKKGIYKQIFETDPKESLVKETEFLAEKIKDVPIHIKNSLKHILKARNQKVVIFLDNSDQRSDNDQQNCFLISQELASELQIPIFVSLRPETFQKSLKSGALSGYHPRAFTIGPPRIDDVVKKRLNFAKKIATGEISTPILGSNISLSNISILIDVMIYSFDQSAPLSELMENISGGNVRKAIDLIKVFFGSGHIDTEKIINIYNKEGSYLIPIHEFIRAITFNDNIYYEPNNSLIFNLFSIYRPAGKSYFLASILLSLLLSNQSNNAGFVETKVIYSSLQGLGYLIDEIDQMVTSLYGKNLIEASPKGKDVSVVKPDMIRITTIGTYHVTRLTKIFTYIDAIISDTSIVSDAIRGKITDTKNIFDRLDRARIFTDYLDQEWSENFTEEKGLIFNWTEVSKEINHDLIRIEKRIERANSEQK